MRKENIREENLRLSSKQNVKTLFSKNKNIVSLWLDTEFTKQKNMMNQHIMDEFKEDN